MPKKRRGTVLTTPKAETEKPLSFGEQKDLFSSLIQAVPEISSARGRQLLVSKSEIGAVLAGLKTRDLLRGRGGLNKEIRSTMTNLLEEREAWYKATFGVIIDLGKVALPKQIPDLNDFGQLSIMSKELPINTVWEWHKSKYPCRSYIGDDLQNGVEMNGRDAANGSYAFFHRGHVEADRQWQSVEAFRLWVMGIKTMACHERLVIEAEYFTKTTKHLDPATVTLCAGSRSSDGSVPRVDWRAGGLYVRWWDPRDALPDVRAREVVS